MNKEERTNVWLRRQTKVKDSTGLGKNIMFTTDQLYNNGFKRFEMFFFHCLFVYSKYFQIGRVAFL